MGSRRARARLRLREDGGRRGGTAPEGRLEETRARARARAAALHLRSGLGRGGVRGEGRRSFGPTTYPHRHIHPCRPVVTVGGAAVPAAAGKWHLLISIKQP